MRVIFRLFMVVTLVFSLSNALAADKVVVIPMGNSHASSGSGLIPVYDGADTFVGFHVAGDYPNENYSLVSSTGYFTRMKNLGIYTLSFEVYYTQTNCTGDPFVFFDPNDMSIFCNNGQAGVVGKETDGNTLVYIPKGADSQFYDTLYEKLGQDCHTASGPGKTVYSFLPNDPAVTGFNSNYYALLRAKFTIPAVP